MNAYLLSIMKGQRNGFIDQLIVDLLLPWSWLYGWGVFGHRLWQRFLGTYLAPQPVISIGNITVGGSGKTPLTIWLARSLQEKGIKSVVLIRGYMPKGCKISDEVDMINEQLPYIPVLAGADRAENIKKYGKALPVDVYIADDAFQHWPLGRDLDIVAIDSSNPFGNGQLLPAGILREPISALKRADVMVLTKTYGVNDLESLSAKLKKINPRALIMESRYKNGAPLDVFSLKQMPEHYLNGKKIVGFCGIGDPLSFEHGLLDSRADLVKLFAFMDHHVYTPADIQHLQAFCKEQGVSCLVTTHKDAVKLKFFQHLMEGIELLYIPIHLEMTKGTDAFFQKIIPICHS